MKRIRQKGIKQRGVVAIETALGMFAFLLMIFYWMEVSYMGFVSALVDYSVTEAGRSAKASERVDYKKIFEAAIKNTNSLWGSFIDVDDLGVETKYCKTVDDLAREACNGAKTNSPIAIYRVSYDYQPLFLSLFMGQKEANAMKISREVITIQEYERSEFNVTSGS